MKYLPESESDCVGLKTRHLCQSCIHTNFCARKNVAEFSQQVVKKEPLTRWQGQDGKKGTGKGGFGVEFDPKG